MKKIKWVFLVLVGLAFLTGCNHKKKLQDVTNSEMRSAYQLTEDHKSGVIRMDSSERKGSVNLNGTDFKYVITRTPDDALPKASDDEGNSYVDNRIILNITAGDRPFFSHTFLKSDFNNMIDSSFVKKGILEGLVFDKVKNGNLNFSVSIAYPQTDMYESLMIEVTPTGGMSIKKDESMDGSDIE